MLRWAIIFLVVALVAAVLGFGGIANYSFEIAKFIAVVAIILFVIAGRAYSARSVRSREGPEPVFRPFSIARDLLSHLYAPVGQTTAFSRWPGCCGSGAVAALRVSWRRGRRQI